MSTTQGSYKVVFNDEGQYSTWSADRPTPRGWHDGEVAGTREHCLDHIKDVWTDLTPRSGRPRPPA